MVSPSRGTSPETLRPHPDLERYYAGGEPGRRAFVRDIFDSTASDYDRVERMMALGSGSWYRRNALERCGLRAGMRVLDVAMGTGLVAREALKIVGSPALLVGLDPSVGMMRQARRTLTTPVLLGFGEQIASRDNVFDFLSMGYALRHMSDLGVTFREFHRVLKPGGTVCVLEMTPPRRGLGRALLRLYVRGIIPVLTRLTTRHAETAFLWQYFWDTMETCVAPEEVLEALREAGFADVKRSVEIGLFSEYTGRKP